MAHEILSAKLYELDKKFAQLHNRIQLSETENKEEIEADIKLLSKECKECRLELYNNMKFSRASNLKPILAAYDKVEKIITELKEQFRDTISGKGTSEEKFLLAEYMLDFAVQAANEALLVSMKAICAQLKEQEE